MKRYQYVEIVKGGAHNRGNVVKLPDNKMNYQLDYFGKEGVDCFHSVFMQSEEYFDFRDPRGGKKGYTGSVFTPYLYWDMDNEDLTKARQDTLELVERLYVYEKKNIKIYFSGNKGFHVFYMCPELESFVGKIDFNETVRQACVKIAGDLKSFDTRIYDSTRIIRTLNSKHSKTNLYKIEVSYEDLTSLSNQELLELAKTQQKADDSFSFLSNKDIEELLNLSNVSTEQTRGVYDGSELLVGISQGFSEGHRNSGLASVAGMLHNRGITTDFVNAFLLAINNNSQDPLPEADVQTIVNSISKYPVSSEYLPVSDEDIVTMAQAGEKWRKIITASGDFSLGDRYKHIIETMDVVLKGDTIGIVANSGCGKSTLLLDMCNEYAKVKGGYSLFLSLEMAQHACYFRAATMSQDADEEGEVSSKDVAYDLLNDVEFRQRVESEWSSTLIVDKGSISLEQVQSFFEKAQELTGGRIAIVALDYLQYLEGAHDIVKMMRMARDVKDVAKKMNVITMLAVQTNKSMKNSYIEVEDEHVEGIKAIVQALDWNMGFWKSKGDSKRLHGKFLKTRWAKTDKRFDLIRSGLRYSTTEVMEESPFDGMGL